MFMNQKHVKAAKDAIIALGEERDWQGLEAVCDQLDHTRRAERLAEVTVGELAERLEEIHPGGNEQVGLMDRYYDALRHALAEDDPLIEGVREQVLARAAASLRASIIADEQSFEDDDVA
jgi:hypothetical protein